MIISMPRSLPTNTYSGQVLVDRPIAYYPCQDTAGAVLIDVTGHGYDLQTYGGVTVNQSGPHGFRSVAFDGSTGYAQAVRTPQPAWIAHGSMTLELWGLITNDLSHYGFLAGIRQSNSGEFYMLQLENTNTLETRFTNSSGTHQDFDGQSDIPTWASHRWHHGALVYDAPAQTLTFFSDGHIVAQCSATGGITVTPMPFWVGAQGGAGDNPFEGNLAHIALYDYALSPRQVLRHVNTARLHTIR
ncbi:LamG domain-containing protein [Sulfobacillus harzensis]|uniref:LamG domain-containing protein n=1 Tax=Sulfobacillus harzensis TaxID=2729629 RepID=A0A7Y0L038_9FIRM|nr:LamG domain-containing protein [Sulfobacillus harzensis]NMP20787.1 LamG domain-containing protein [Sulfobacillus harzensis]